MRRNLTVILLALLVHEPRAQFGQFQWTLQGNPEGSGFATPTLLHVVGPDGGTCTQGTATWLETVAPYPATISVIVDYITLDDWPSYKYFDAPAWVVDGVVFQPESQTGWFSDTYTMEFDVLPGQHFGFGIWAQDCCCGPGIGDFRDLVVTPHEWLGVGEPIDPQQGPVTSGKKADRVGDVNADGHEDFVTGNAPTNTVSLRSGADGSVLFSEHEPGNLGTSVAGAGDLDADGVPDFAAGAPQQGPISKGAVHAWRGSDGTELFLALGPFGSAQFGSVLAGPGDLDSDGCADLAARSGNSIRLLGGPDGHSLGAFGSGPVSDLYGYALCGAGDLDLDGVPDLLVGVPSTVAGNTGRIEVRSGATHAVLLSLAGTSNGFGRDVAAAGDLDHDGVGDLLISEPTFVGDAIGFGAITAASGAGGGVLYRIEDVMGTIFESIAGGTDLTGDGEPDFLTTAGLVPPRLQVRNGSTGEVLLEFPGSGAQSVSAEVALVGNVDATGPADAALIADGVHVFKALDGAGPPLLEGFGHAVADEPIGFMLTHAPAGATALLVLGATGVQLPFLGGVLQPHPDVLLPLQVSLDGGAVLQGRWPTGLPSGTSIWAQAWIPDPAGPQGWTCTHGLAVTQLGP